MTGPRIVFLDTETTSLRHDRRAWEIGLVLRTDDGSSEHHWFVDADDLDLGGADLMSLRIGGFYQRHPDFCGFDVAQPEAIVLAEVEELTRDAIIVGAVPNFDTEVLSARMRAHHICPSWHYHLVDVETLAAGAMRLPPPWGFDDILAAYGLVYDPATRHTASGDVDMVQRLYDAVMAGAVPSFVGARS